MQSYISRVNSEKGLALVGYNYQGQSFAAVLVALSAPPGQLDPMIILTVYARGGI